MAQHFFITGTDTEVGKTYVTCALLRDLRRRGLPAVGYKPLACGDRGDARAMQAASDPSLPLDVINPIYLRAATAPYVAAQLENRRISPAELVAGYRRICGAGSPVLVEGAGGWEVPIAPGYSIADFAAELGLPVVLVVGNKLGAVNHALLSIAAIRARGLELRALVLNHAGESWDTAAVTNRRLLEEFAGVTIAAELICGQDDIDSAAVLGI
ncbi:MAG: dethiobiotin synthase [Akkermansia sp.]